MAVSTIPQPAGQGPCATTDEARPGGCSVRERFDALPQHLKDAILDKHRYWNVDHIDWWDSVYEQFSEDMDAIGIEVHKMYFSGFWSQGDGACFAGRVSDWPMFLASLGHKCPALINHADAAFQFSVEHRGHYYHENCTHFDVDLPLPNNDEDEEFAYRYLEFEAESVQESVALVLLNQYNESSLEQEFRDAFKDHMRELYRRLNDEYNYLTSDEAVLDALEAHGELEETINHLLENEDA